MSDSFSVPEPVGEPIISTSTPGFPGVTGEKIGQGVPQDEGPRRLVTALARLSSQPIRDMLALTAQQEPAAAPAPRGKGRPTVLPRPVQQQLCLLLKFGYSRSLAALELGISRSTITHLMRRDAEFRREVLEAEALFERTPLLTVLQAAQTSWRAAVWLMKNYKPHASVTRRKLRKQRKEAAASYHSMTEGMWESELRGPPTRYKVTRVGKCIPIKGEKK